MTPAPQPGTPRRVGMFGGAFDPPHWAHRALAETARRERYLAHELLGRRHDLDLHYGLLATQLALGLAGKDRDEVLSLLVELLAQSQA